jgi:hypothetical protein
MGGLTGMGRLLVAVKIIKASKKKLPTLTSLKKKLWKLTSLYVRLRDADDLGMVKCSTCEMVKHFKQMQAGHFVSKAHGTSVYFALSNIHPQCYRCNMNLGSNGPWYYIYMLERYGQDVISELMNRVKTKVVFSREDYEDRIKSVSRLLKPLLDKHKGTL